LARHSTLLLLEDLLDGSPCDVGADRSESDSADRELLDGLAVLVAVDVVAVVVVALGPRSLTDASH